LNENPYKSFKVNLRQILGQPCEFQVRDGPRTRFSYTMPRPASPGGGHGGGGSEAWAAYILQNSTQHVHL
jgi:hypothetical protein